MRDERKRDERVDADVQEHIFPAVQCAHLHRAQRAHRERFAVHNVFLHHEDARRDEHHERRHRRREVRLVADLVDEFGVNHDGHDVEALADEHRRAEVRHGVHEDHERARENRRRDERNNDRHDLADAAAAEAFRRLDERRVDVLHRAGDVEVDERIKLQRQDEQDARETVNRWEINAVLREESRDVAVAAADEDPRIRADERRREQRDDDADFDRVLEAHAVERHEIRDGRADDDGEHRHACRDGKAVDHRLVVVFALEEMREVRHAPRARLCILERADEEREQRIDEEQREDRHG